MKKLLVGLTLSTLAMTAQARQYTQEYGVCTFDVTVQDMFNGERDLPFSFDIKYILAFDRDNNEYLGQRTLVLPQVNATSGVSFQDIQNVTTGITFDAERNVSINLASEAVGSIIAYAGDYRALYNSHELPSVAGVYSSGESFCVQSHLEPGVDSGVSYHICGECIVESSDRDNSGSTPSVPGQKIND